jgi:threonine dehydratase
MRGRTAALRRVVCSSPPNVVPSWDCVKFEDVVRAHHRIRSGIIRTSCERSHWLSLATGCEVYLKSEQLQFTGSFKERGGRNALLSLSPEKKQIGVIAASAGNHALALAWHGSQLGIPVTVVMPTVAPMAKVEKCRGFGVNVVIHGAHIGEAKEHAQSDPQFAGLTYINGYDDPEIVAGAGTLGIEMLEQVPDADFVIVPVGGAGLIAGVALAAKTLNPNICVIGVEPERCASFTAALKAGHPVTAAVAPTLADGLAVPQVGPHAFEVARHWVDEVVQVTERELSIAMLRLVEGQKAVVEGGGAAGLAALLPGAALDRPRLKGKKVLVPLCGGNIDTTILGRVIERGLSADCRMLRISSAVSDRPGGLAHFTRVLAGLGASVKDIFHERAWLYSSIDQVLIQRASLARPHQLHASCTLANPLHPTRWSYRTPAIRLLANAPVLSCNPTLPNPLSPHSDQVLIKCVLETSGPEHNAAIVKGLREHFPETHRIDGEPGGSGYRG